MLFLSVSRITWLICIHSCNNNFLIISTNWWRSNGRTSIFNHSRNSFKSHKIRSTFYTESTLCKVLCKLRDRVVTEDKNNIVYIIDCSNCERIYFRETKCSVFRLTQKICQELQLWKVWNCKTLLGSRSQL